VPNIFAGCRARWVGASGGFLEERGVILAIGRPFLRGIAGWVGIWLGMGKVISGEYEVSLATTPIIL